MAQGSDWSTTPVLTAGDQSGAAVGVHGLPPDLRGAPEGSGQDRSQPVASDSSNDPVTAAMTASTARRASSVSAAPACSPTVWMNVAYWITGSC